MYSYDKNRQAWVDEENLDNSLYSGSLSNIDLQVDQHLYQSVQDTANSNLAEKFKFPKSDPIIINMHEDKRTVNEKRCNINHQSKNSRRFGRSLERNLQQGC